MTDQAANPFDDIRRLITMMPGPDEEAVAAVRERDRQLTKPAGSLGRMEEIVEWLAAWQGNAKPCRRPAAGLRVRRGSHGVVARGVSPYPSVVNRQMLENFSAGGAAINQICAAYEPRLQGVRPGARPADRRHRVEPPMDEKSCVATMAFGMEAIAGGTDLLGVGEMGIGNTTIAAAIYAALYRRDRSQVGWARHGVDDAGMVRKADAVEMALRPHRAIWTIRSKFCAGSADGKSPPWPARSSPRACSAFPWSRRLCVTAAAAVLHALDPRPPWTTASPGMFRPRACTAKCSNGSVRCPLLASACGSAKAPAPALATGSSRPPPHSPRHGDLLHSRRIGAHRRRQLTGDSSSRLRTDRLGGWDRLCSGTIRLAGMITVASVPSPTREVSTNLPPCSSASPFTIGRPRPTPWAAVDTASEPRPNDDITSGISFRRYARPVILHGYVLAAERCPPGLDRDMAAARRRT